MNWLFSILAGAATGVLSGFGVGGGTLLLLWLTLVQGMGQFQAGGVNLVYFISCALPALWGHFRQGLVEKKAALWCILAGVPACAAGEAVISPVMWVNLHAGMPIPVEGADTPPLPVHWNPIIVRSLAHPYQTFNFLVVLFN